MTDRWIFEPYVGVGPIKFGMSIIEVEKILGKPKDTIQRPGRKLREFRGDLIIIYSKENSTVEEISCFPGIKIYYQDKNIIQDDVFSYLKQFDNQPYEDVGIVVFLKLGVAMTGYHDNHEDQKNVTFFKEGVWVKDGLKLYTS